MKRLPVIIERTRNQVRALAFKSSVMSASFEQTHQYQFESELFSEQNEELNNFIREYYFESPSFYINIPVEEIILRELTLPFITRSKIKDLLPFELESVLPYEINEIYYDYHIYPDPEKNISKIIVAACRRSFLDEYTSFFLLNKFPIKGFYIPVDSLVQFASLNKESPNVLLYMSSSYSSVLILKEGTWDYSRIIPIGYDSLFSSISGLWKKDFQESKKLLTEIPVSDSEIIDQDYYRSKFKLSRPKSKEFVESILKFSKSINREVSNTLMKTSGEFNKISLLTDLDNQVFLENILSHKHSIEILPYPYGSTQVSLIGRNYLIPIGMSYAISKNTFINLLVSDLKKKFKEKKERKVTPFLVFASLSLLFFLGSFVINGLQKKKQFDLVQERKSELFLKYFNKVPSVGMSLTVQANQLVDEQKKRSEVYKLQANKYKLSKIMVELNGSLTKSSDFSLERFIYSNNTVNISANTNDFNELNHIKSLVSENPIVDEVEVKEQRSFLAKGGQNRVRFNMIIKPKVQED